MVLPDVSSTTGLRYTPPRPLTREPAGSPTGGSTTLSTISEQVSERLAPYLGPFNAEVWVKTVSERKLGRPVEQLTAADVTALLDGLRPSLNTFMGRTAAGDLLLQIGREVR